jgi:A-kinase anchor protein 8
VAAEVLAEVITAAVRAVEGEEEPAAQHGEGPAEGEGPVDITKASSDPHTEQPLEEQTSCGTASEEEDTEGKARSQAVMPLAETESTITVAAPVPTATEAEVGQTYAESKDDIPAE